MKLSKILLTGGAAALSVLALASCDKVADGMRISLASTPDNIDPALNSTVDGASYDVHLFAGLIKYAPNKDGEMELSPDLATTIPTAQNITTGSDNGKVKYTFTLRDNIKFSDGSDITAQDFVDSWNRAGSVELGADYNYMFDILDMKEEKYETKVDSEGNSKQVLVSRTLNVTATDNKTLEVVLPQDVPYFIEVCAFPAYSVLKTSTVNESGSWAKSKKAVTSGAYTIAKYKKDVKMTLVKNDNYWDSENTVNDRLTFVFADDDSSIYSQYQNGELVFIDSYPQKMQDDVAKMPDYHNISQLGTYYICFNINANTFGDKTQAQQETLRKAIGLLIDRKDIIESVTKSGQTPSTGFVGSGLSDGAFGGEFVEHNGVNNDGSGYFGDANNYSANKEKALEMIASCGYTVTNGVVSNFPTLNYLYNTKSENELIALQIQSQLKAVGITFTIEHQDWAQFLNTRKDGDYTIARNGWLSDYNDPISFLDLWTSDSGNNDAQFGKDNAKNYQYEIDLTGIGNYTKLSGTWAETYDTLISYIKKETDTVLRYKLMHKAEDLVMSTGCLLSIYNYTDSYLQKTNLKNVYTSPLGYKFFMYSYIEEETVQA